MQDCLCRSDKNCAKSIYCCGPTASPHRFSQIGFYTAQQLTVLQLAQHWTAHSFYILCECSRQNLCNVKYAHLKEDESIIGVIPLLANPKQFYTFLFFFFTQKYLTTHRLLQGFLRQSLLHTVNPSRMEHEDSNCLPPRC